MRLKTRALAWYLGRSAHEASMNFHGLFVGIDRYASTDIAELTCARRDAVALEALFADTLGGETLLLTDADATLGRIETELDRLTAVSPDDVVVIAFSGHGSPNHELVTYDTNLHDLDNSTLPLDRLASWFSKIPAKRLVLLLDCCFSGGLGAKVLQVDGVARGLHSPSSRLDELAGDGRLILTASSPDEPAYESPRFGHGFFTYHVLEALQGAPEVVVAGKISVYRLLEHVTNRVIDAARLIGRPQHPTLRGRIDGELSWPVFSPGTRYLAAFPALASAKATPDVSSLADFGFPPDLLAAWGGAIPSLNELQIAAINDYGVLDSQHLVVSAPTSSGKTMVGELAALKNTLSRRRALFLLPLKALVADKQRHFNSVYGTFGLRTIVATGETDDITPLLRGQFDVALLTYEKFASIVLTHPHVLDQAGVVVVDEAQMIADQGRGANLEFLLTLITMRRSQGVEPQLIALSAVIGDMNGFDRWLGARLLRTTTRPVALDEGTLLGTGEFRYIDGDTAEERRIGPIVRPFFSGKGSSQDLIIPLVRKLVSEGQQVIVFRETKGETRGCAKYLADALELPPAEEALALLPSGDLSQASSDLRQTLRGGIAFHNADLDPEERRVVEEHFRVPASKLRVIAATTTLAMGVNTPASSVVIAGLEHPGTPSGTPYAIAEYKNLVGRAGRLGFSERGASYLIAMSNAHYYWFRYVLGAPEDLVSRFLDPETDPRTLILRVVVAARQLAETGISADDIIGFLESSFGAFQARQRSDAWRWSRAGLEGALGDLETNALLKRAPTTSYKLTELGRLAGESTIEVESVIRLVEALRPLSTVQVTDPALIVATQLTLELDSLLFPLNKKSTQKEPAMWPGELQRQGVPSHLTSRLGSRVTTAYQGTLRAKKAVACLLYISPETLRRIEARLTQFGGEFDGAAGPIRSVAARTADLLPTVARVAELLHPDLEFGNRVGRLVTRLTYGAPAAAADLARYAGSALLRGDYLRLAAKGLCEPQPIAAADDETILACVDGDHVRLRTVREAAEQLQRHRDRLALLAEASQPLPAYEQ